jgi:hypothetical protein
MFSHLPGRSGCVPRSLALVVALGATVGQSVSVASAKPGGNEQAHPLVALLKPQDGLALNAATLEVQALAAAFNPDEGRRFLFNGEDVPGRNAGRLHRVELTLDGSAIAGVEPETCRRQVTVTFPVDLSALAAGPHTLTVTAYQASGRGPVSRSVSASFILDPALPFAEGSRVEDAATPQPFSCFKVRSEHALDFDREAADPELAGQESGQQPRRLSLTGTLVPGQQSDGIDPTRDRIVIALGSHVTAIEPEALRCREMRGRRRCQYNDRARPLVQNVRLVQRSNRSWQFKIQGDELPPGAEIFYLRIGNDWGGIDLRTGEVRASLRSELDTSRRAQAVIGPEGGTIATTDASGVVIRLDVPPDALPRDVAITVTPLLTSPLPDSSAALHPGVLFEPAGLRFDKPAALILDFSATGQQIEDRHFVSLLTSPLTAVPLFGAADPDSGTLSVVLHHFSQVQAGAGNSAYLDFVAWADPILAAGGNLLTVTDIQDLLALLRVQIRVGCSVQSCVDPEALQRLALISLDVLVGAACTAEILANPSDDAFRRLLEIERLLFEFLPLGPPDGPFRDCLHDMLEELIEQARAEAQTDPTAQHLERLLDLSAEAGTRDLDDLKTLAYQGLAAALRSLLAEGEQLCQTDPEVGRVLLERARQFETTDSEPLAAVDPTLGNDIGDALNDCGEGGMTVTLVPNTFVQAVSRVCGPADQKERTLDVLEADTAPPVFLSAQGGGGEQMQATISEPEANVLAWDVAGNSSPIGVATAVFNAELSFSGAGTLTAEINQAWSSGFTLPNGLRLQPGPAPLKVDADHPVASVEIPGAATVLFLGTVQTGNPACGMTPVYQGSGSGRLLTLTFTPSES